MWLPERPGRWAGASPAPASSTTAAWCPGISRQAWWAGLPSRRNDMKRRVQAMLMAAALALAPLAHATSHESAAFTNAEVRKVDKAAGKVTLKHGPIGNLEMPPMTMVFRVKEPA